MARHRATTAVSVDAITEPSNDELLELEDEDISFDENEIFVDDDEDDDDEAMSIPVIEQYEKGRARMNLATDSSNTIWEPATLDRIKSGDTVRAKNQYGTIIFGVVSP